MEFRQFLDIIDRHKYMIILMCISAIVTATMLTYVVSEKYTSSTIVIIRPKKSLNMVPRREEILSFPVSYFTPVETASKTYSEIIKSRAVAERVVRLLGLDSFKKEEGAGLKYYWEKIKNKTKEAIGKIWALLKYGRIEEDNAFNYAVLEVQKGLTVKPTKETYLFELEVEARSPILAASIANTAAKVLVDYLRELNVLEQEYAKKFSKEKLQSSKKRLDEAKKALTEYKENVGIVSIKNEMKLELQSLVEFENEWKTVRSEISGEIAKESVIVRQLAELERTSNAVTKITDNPLKRELNIQLVKKDIELAGLLKRYTPEHTDVQALQAEANEIKAKLEQEAPNFDGEKALSVNPIYQGLLGELSGIRANLEYQKAKNDNLALAIEKKKRLVEEMPQKESTLSELDLDAKLSEETYRLIAMEYEELGISEALNAPEISVIHNAVAPLYPVGPIKIHHAALAGILSLIVGVGIALMSEYMNTTIRTRFEAESRLALPVLATIPKLKSTQQLSLPIIDVNTRVLTNDMRSYERIYKQLQIEVTRQGGSMIMKGLTEDISFGGVRFSVKEPFYLNRNDNVEVSIILSEGSGEKVVTSGIVLRIKDVSAEDQFSTIAVEFKDTSWAYTEKVKNLFKDIESNPLAFSTCNFVEPIHTLRSDLQFFNNREISSFLITSCIPQEGKSAVVSNLANSLVNTNKKVILIDANLRSPSIHKLFKLSNDLGIANYLITGEGPCVQKDKSGLSIITAGRPFPDSSALLGSIKMRELFDVLKRDYDFVLIDSPPLLVGPDAAILSSIAQGTILIISSGKISIEESTRAKQILKRANANILGLILSNPDSDKSFFYS